VKFSSLADFVLTTGAARKQIKDNYLKSLFERYLKPQTKEIFSPNLPRAFSRQ
jgi:hypothetical protein